MSQHQIQQNPDMILLLFLINSETACVLPTNTSVSCQNVPLDNIMQEKLCYERVGVNDS